MHDRKLPPIETFTEEEIGEIHRRDAERLQDEIEQGDQEKRALVGRGLRTVVTILISLVLVFLFFLRELFTGGITLFP